MKIENVMTRGVKTCRPEDTLARAAQIFWDLDCGVVPVVDGENRVVGMLTDRDVCMAAWFGGRPLDALCVADAMADRVYVCRTDDSIASASSMMRAKRVRRLPVLDEAGRLAGIVSLNDLVRHAARDDARMSPQELVAVMAAVCEPRTRPDPTKALDVLPPRAVVAPQPPRATVAARG